MARTVRDERDEVGVRSGRSRAQAIERRTDGLHDGQVGALVQTTDIIGAPGLAPLEHHLKGAGVILDVQPVADLVPLAIDRQRFASQRLDDDQRYELFREVEGPVIVGAVGHHHGQVIGMTPG